MKKQFVKVITYYGEVVWLNIDNIVSIKESDELSDTFIIMTNAVDESGKSKCYAIQGSPEVFFNAFDSAVDNFL